MKLKLRLISSRRRGQSLVEFALVLPVMALMLSAVVEFGLAMNTDVALETASREGARIGAELGNGGTGGLCPNATAEATVDPSILAAIQASLSNTGVNMSTIQVWIFLADTNGNPTTGSINKYSWLSGAWTSSTGDVWKACSRHDGTFGGGIYDDVGIQIQYTYTSQTGLLGIFTGGLPMSARAVFPIGPPWQ